MGHDPGSFG
jgi:hypothetical protein